MIMEGSSSKKNRARKVKETQPLEDKPKRQKKEGFSLAQDLIDQCPTSSLRSKKHKMDEEGLEDRIPYKYYSLWQTIILF